MKRPPCEICDTTGPELDTLYGNSRALHRALAAFGWAYVEALHLPQFVAWLARRTSHV